MGVLLDMSLTGAATFTQLTCLTWVVMPQTLEALNQDKSYRCCRLHRSDLLKGCHASTLEGSIRMGADGVADLTGLTCLR